MDLIVSGILSEILDDEVVPTPSSNQPIFSKENDFAKIRRDHQEAMEKWGRLTEFDRKEFGSIDNFLNSHGVIDPRDDKFLADKNYYLMKNEVEKRVSEGVGLQLLPVDVVDFDTSVIELAESMENIEQIRGIYKFRKKTTGNSKNAGINNSEAAKLKNCFSQGRELYLAGKKSSLLVKPLNFFYALTAYTYGIIVLNNPIRFNKGNLPGSHGMEYLPNTVKAQFGGDVPKGTFSDLVASFPTQVHIGAGVEITQDCSDSVYELYFRKFSTGMGTLLSMVPEMSDYYKLVTGRHGRAHPLEVINASDTRTLKWEFQIGTGEHKPTMDAILESFPDFKVHERFGKIIVSIPASEAYRIKACIYTDVKGKFWFIENPFFPVVLPEVAVHFLLSNIYSSIMRYRPDEWGSVLTNDVSSNVSLITRRYFSTFERKFFPMILRVVSRYVPFAS